MKALTLAVILMTTTAWAGVDLNPPIPAIARTNRSAVQWVQVLGAVTNGAPANGFQFTNINAGSVTGLFSLNLTATTAASVTPGDSEIQGNNASYAAGTYGVVYWLQLTNPPAFTLTTLRCALTGRSMATNVVMRLFTTTTTNPPANVFTVTPLYSNLYTVAYNNLGTPTNSLHDFSISPAVAMPSSGYLWVTFMAQATNISAMAGNGWINNSANTNNPRLVAAYMNANGTISKQTDLYVYGNAGFGLSGYTTGTAAGTAQDAINYLASGQAALSAAVAGGAVTNMTAVISSNYLYAVCQWSTSSNWIQKMSLQKTGVAWVQPYAEYLLPVSVSPSLVPSQTYTSLKTDSDDACPIDLYQTYIGANHGASIVDAVTANGHGKTAVDVGSVWQDGGAHQYTLVSVPDVNTLWLVQSFGGSGAAWTAGYTMSGTTLTHVSGATHAASITVGSDVANTQMLPSVSNQTAQVYLNGVTPIANDGTYPCQFVDVVNTYTIFNPPSVIAYLQANVGNSPTLSDPAIPGLARVTVRYRYAQNGACTVFQTIRWLQPAKVNYAGFVQAGPPGPGTGTNVWMYVPGSTTWSNWYSLSNTTQNVSADAWVSTNTPPSRFVEMYAPGDVNTYGYQIGYAPLGLGIASNRFDRVVIAGQVYSSEKMYPRVVEFGSTNYVGGLVSSNEVWDVVGLRAPVNPATVTGGIVSWWNVGASYYAAIDIQTNYSGIVSLPLPGMTITPVESYNMTLDSLMVGEDGVSVTATNGPGYCTFFVRP